MSEDEDSNMVPRMKLSRSLPSSPERRNEVESDERPFKVGRKNPAPQRIIKENLDDVSNGMCEYLTGCSEDSTDENLTMSPLDFSTTRAT